jgi:glycosyltransferase involved in cell wall biosynthesis
MSAGTPERDVIRRLNVVHVISSLQTGGMERVVLRLASAQRDGGSDVSVLALRPGSLLAEANARNLRTGVLSGGRLARMLQALDWFRERRPDIVHVHNATSLHYGILSRLVSPARVVVTLHGDLHSRLGSSFEWRLVDASVAVSDAAARTLRLPRTAPPLQVVRNGISLPAAPDTRPASPRALVGGGRPVLGIVVARIDGRKGHRTLVQAMRIVEAAAPGQVRMLVAGDGTDRPAVELLANSAGLNDQAMVFLGTRTDVDDLLAAADFFVLPSDTEGLPLSVLEAMSHGLPIVASRVGGIPEIVDDAQEGLLVPPGEPQALADAIVHIVEDVEMRRRLGRQALERARTRLSFAETVREYEAIYRQVVR